MKILKGGKVMKVNECMCNDVCCVKPEDNVENVAKVYPNIINKYLVIWSFLKY